MLLKELPAAWPPTVSDPSGPVKPDLGDVVISVQNNGGGMLVVTLRKPGKYGQEYNVALPVPESVFQKTLFSIVRKAGITLGEVGEITI